MSKRKVLVLCPLHADNQSSYEKQIAYMPELESTHIDLDRWKTIVEQYRPSTIIFGGGLMSSEMLNLWRNAVPDEKLRGIRRGTTLARCDLVAAKSLGIEIFNTPGVNAPFVAQFAYDCFEEADQVRICAILGLGNIGEKVTKLFSQNNCQLRLMSRKLLDPETRQQALNRIGVPLEKVSVESDVVSACRDADAVIVTLPLTSTTRGILNKEVVELLKPGCKIVCISLFEVFSPEALQILHKRKDITVILDGLVRSLPDVLRTVGVNEFRSGFTFAEKASRTEECQKAMDEAVLKLI